MNSFEKPKNRTEIGIDTKTETSKEKPETSQELQQTDEQEMAKKQKILDTDTKLTNAIKIATIKKFVEALGIRLDEKGIERVFYEIKDAGPEEFITQFNKATENTSAELYNRILEAPSPNEQDHDEIGFDVEHIDTPANIESINTPIPFHENEYSRPHEESKNNKGEEDERNEISFPTSSGEEVTVPKFSRKNIDSKQVSLPHAREQIIAEEKPKSLFDTIKAHPPIKEGEEFTFLGTRAEQLKKDEPPIEPTKPGFKFPPQPPAAM